MKKRSIFAALFLMICLVTANLYYTPDTVSAKELAKISQAKKLAKKQVKGASVIKAEKDDDDGMIVFEVKLSKGKKLYDLVYRASDSKLISYDWEIKSRYIKKASGKSISTSQCRSLAKKQVSGASITSIVKKYNDGISIYKVKMKKKNKKYELRFHAITGKLLEYEWELTSQGANSQSSGKYIGEEKASQIALGEVGGGTVVKVKFEVDDGIPTYEIDIINGDFKYEIKIHAKTGKVLETEQESISGNQVPPQETTSQITLEAAKEIAAADAGVSVSEVTYTKAKLDHEDGILVYEIEFCTATHECEYKINAYTGAIYSKKKEVLPGGGSSSGDSGSTEETDIGIEAAKQIALQEAGGGTVVKAKADRDDGIMVYEVEITNGNFKYEIKIHAQTGKILEVDKEYKENSQQPSDEESKITLEEAKAAALTDAGVTEDEVTYTRAKLDREEGILVYEIEFHTATHEYEYEINASTGAVYSKKKEVLPGGGSSSGGSGSTEETDIGIEAAKQIALQEAGGGTVVKAKADRDDGIMVYEVEIINGNFKYEIKIHAQTGKILEVDKEYKENSQQPSDEESKITLEEAKAAALTDAGVTEDEVTYTRAKLDREEGILVYEIEFHTATHEYEYEINASTGAVYSKKKEVLPGGGSSSGGSGSTEETDIGIEAAKQIALKVAGGVTIQKAELEQEDGVYVYEIKIRNGEQEYEIKINAQTGEVLEVDVESVHS